MARIGFIGVGVMGSAMARHLLIDGHDVTVFDMDPHAIDELVDAGATGATSSAEAVAGAEVVFFSLPSPESVIAVVDETEDALSEGSVLVDLTTSTPETTNKIAERLASRDVSVLGAPVSGGASGAEDATLTTIVGGDPAVYEACLEFFYVIGENSFHVGHSPGDGHAVKLLNNYLSFTALLATSEAVILGKAAGLDPAVLVDVFNVSTGRNSATETKFPEAIISETYDAGFTLDLMEKDMSLLSQFSEDQNVPLLIADLVKTLIELSRVHEGNHADMTRTYAVLEAFLNP